MACRCGKACIKTCLVECTFVQVSYYTPVNDSTRVGKLSYRAADLNLEVNLNHFFTWTNESDQSIIEH